MNRLKEGMKTAEYLFQASDDATVIAELLARAILYTYFYLPVYRAVTHVKDSSDELTQCVALHLHLCIHVQ